MPQNLFVMHNQSKPWNVSLRFLENALSLEIPSHNHFDISHIKSSCATCSLRELCLPVGLNEDEIQVLGDVVSHKRKIQRGGYLHHTGSKFQSLFAIRSGFLKTCVLEQDGRQQVTGFHMTGELLGLDAISTEVHTCDAIALED